MEMNEYFSRLEALIAVWVREIELHTKTGSTDKNKYSEFIAAKLLNAAFSYNLEILPKNHPAVDLGDKKAGIAFQITSRTDTEKIKTDLHTFNDQNLVSDYPNGMRFLLLVNQKPRWQEDTKNEFNRLLPGFDADRDIFTFPGIVEALKKKYLDNSEIFQELLDMMERQFGKKGGAEPLEMVRQRLRDSSRAYYDALRGPNGRFRFLKISDILLPGTKSQWLETCANIDNEKFSEGPGPRGAGDLRRPFGPSREPLNCDSQLPQSAIDSHHSSFIIHHSTMPPGRRRQNNLTIFEVLPKLWCMEVKHAVIIGDGGMGKTVSLIHWWEKLLDTGEPTIPIPLFIALNEFNQVPEGKRENFILGQVVENYGKEVGVPVTALQVEKIMKTPLRSGSDFIPSVILLLDGFNEITVEKCELLLELNRLTERYPGIQVVITGRVDMRSQFNWNHWHPVKLKELEDDQVEEYLREHGMAGMAMPGTGRLWDLIKNPMMLTLYAETLKPSELPENFDSSDKALLLRNIAEIYREEKKFYKAYSFAKEAFNLDNFQETGVIYKLGIYAALAGDVSNALIYIKRSIDLDWTYSKRINNEIDWEDIKKNIVNYLGCFAAEGKSNEPHAVDEFETLFNSIEEVKGGANYDLLADVKKRFGSAYEMMKNPSSYISFNCIRNLFKLKDIHPRVKNLISLYKGYSEKSKEYSEIEYKFKKFKPFTYIYWLLFLASWVRTTILFAHKAQIDLTGNILERVIKIGISLIFTIFAFIIDFLCNLLLLVIGKSDLTSERFIWAYITIFLLFITIPVFTFFSPDEKLKGIDEERKRIENEIKAEETNIIKQFDDIKWE